MEITSFMWRSIEVKEIEELIKQILQEIPYHLQRMEFGAEIDGTEDFFQVNPRTKNS